jgi:RHS repeat-associated protein
MVSTNYSDSTPDITMAYDAMGRQSTQSNGVATSTFTFNSSNLQIDTETVAYDLNADNTTDFTRVIDRSQDNLGRESGWQLKDGTTVENEVAYAYGTTDGRLSSVSKGASSFGYTYVPNSSLIATVTSPVHTVSNVYETTRNVLASKVNKVNTTTISGYFYTVNNYGQRTGVNKDGTAFASTRTIAWGYNSKGEVVKADSSESGLDRAYQYDGIGNRLKSADSLTLPGTNNYTPNILNQYTAINSLTPVHDDDGNMTSGPLPANINANSTLIWDGENRLIEAQVNSGATVTYLYDAQSRRIAETVGTATTVYVYDGWNPIAEYSTTYALTKTYTWGIDLSGSMQGAGGVGGLLSVTDGTGTYIPTFDGNGNVSEYLDATGSIAAHYEYDPFGKTTVATGSKAQDFAHRFSTKPLDATTGLYYYGNRYYDPETGRWPSRDPIEERGGVNLYGFVGNDGVNEVDLLGMNEWVIMTSPYGDVTTGNANTTSEIWTYLDKNNILKNSDKMEVRIIKDKELLIIGETLQTGKVTTNYPDPEQPDDTGCWCITVQVDHIVDSLTMYLGSMRELGVGKDYKGYAAHEANHVQAGFRRIYKVVSDYDKKPQPCFTTWGGAANHSWVVKDEIKALIKEQMELEAAHDPNGNYGTPANNALGVWTGPPAW